MKYIEMSIYNTKKQFKNVLNKNKFVLKPDAGWLWLQKLCFWILNKLECWGYDSVESLVYKKHVNLEEIQDEILSQVNSIMRKGYEVDFIILGNQEYNDLSSYCHSFTPFYYTEDEYKLPTFKGYEIRLINWFKGVLVVPKPR